MWRLTCLVTSRVTPWHLPDLQQTQQYQTSANHCPSLWYTEQYGETDRVFLPGLKTRQAGERSNWFREAGRTGFRLRAMSRFDMMDKTTEEVINSIQITEGPVTTMSLGVQKSSRTPYSDATKVSKVQSERVSQRDERRTLRVSKWWGYCDTYGSSASRIYGVQFALKDRVGVFLPSKTWQCASQSGTVGVRTESSSGVCGPALVRYMYYNKPQASLRPWPWTVKTTRPTRIRDFEPGFKIRTESLKKVKSYARASIQTVTIKGNIVPWERCS